MSRFSSEVCVTLKDITIGEFMPSLLLCSHLSALKHDMYMHCAKDTVCSQHFRKHIWQCIKSSSEGVHCLAVDCYCIMC